jgi:PAS domain S-box-containing protein
MVCVGLATPLSRSTTALPDPATPTPRGRTGFGLAPHPCNYPAGLRLDDHLAAAERARLFDAIEQAAAQIGLAMFVVHVDADPPVMLFASELLAKFVGRPVSELTGKAPWELVAESERVRVRALIETRGPGAPPLALQVELERPDGARREVEVGVARIATPVAELAVCYFREVTGERAALEALRRSEAGFRSLIENAPDAVVISRRGRIVHANAVAARLLGAPDVAAVIGRMITDFVPADDGQRAMDRIAQVTHGVNVGATEYRVLAVPDRAVEIKSIPIEWEGAPAVLAFGRDVSERRRMQLELERAGRLAAVGTMAATVAHEINNPLTYVQLSLQRIERELAADGEVPREVLREHVKNAMHGTERVATIVRDLRAFARDDDAPAGPVDVIAVVDRALKMVEHDLVHRARLVRRFAGAVPAVEAVPGRLEQVVVNLLINAIQALPAADPARDSITVTVSAGTTEVTIAVADTGVGIADADRDRVFEPFFTTKPIGEGTGLGLAVCKRIVDSMRGRIAITSAPGAGTEVTVTLPAVTATARAPRPTPPPPVTPRLRVLVIDDEPMVRKVVRMTLGPYHEVEVAAGGEAGLALLADQTFDVILCDVMMPGMSGREVYEQIRARHPGLERRIVLITGGAFVPRLAEFVESVDNLKLLKPFTEDQVLSVIAETVRRR